MSKNKKSKNKRINVGDFLGMAVVAAAAGFVTGILFAPKSGAKTRKILNAAIKETIDRFKFLMLEATVMSEELMEKGMEKADEISSKVKNR